MLTPDLLRSQFAAGLPYERYVATGTPRQQEAWGAVGARVALTDAQRDLVASFTRRVNVLVSSGVWCGDCSAQCPILHAIAAAAPAVDLRLFDRDGHAGFAERVMICGGLRVPTVVFANEDFDFVALTGDRSLSRYRAMAARQLGPSCPLPGAPVPPDELAATTQDWVDEFERVHLLLRMSPKLRQRHGD